MPQIRERLERAGLAALVPRVLADTWNEVRITTTDDDPSTLGRSRIGGLPDLPRGTGWPGALPFVAQLALAELAPLQSVLPRRGHLWLFADQEVTVGELGGYPCCASACLYAVDADLLPAVAPAVPEILPAFALAFAAAPTLPDANDLDLWDDQWCRYAEAVADLVQPEPRHACLSRPECGSIGHVPPAGTTAILRVDSDYRGDRILNWGDAAWITFAIPDVALAAERFDEVRAFRWIG